MPLTRDQVLLGKYKVEKRLGSGGWGVVYLAEDLRLNRQVAIKHLKADWAKDETSLQRFLQEARVIAALRHPNVVIIYALEQDGDEHYIVEEYAERGTVSDLLEEQAELPIEQVLDIVIAICQALEVVHLKEIIHRDIKPSNILLCESPEGNLIPKLCDFGIAHVPNAGDKRPLTADGDMLGTFQYMSPEQIQSAEIDERSDLYSLGAVLYEMLTGQSVFTGSAWDVLQAHVNKAPQSPVIKRQEISASLNDLVLRTLSKEPARRCQKARDMREALEQIKAQEMGRLEKARALYAQGVAHLQAGEWQQAIQSLGDVVALAPDYQDAEALLAQARRDEELERLYHLGLTHIAAGAWAEAIEALERVRRLDENYGDVTARLEQVRTRQQLATWYGEAIQAMQTQDWRTAAARLGEILRLDENYQDAKARLEKAEKQQRLAELYAGGVAHIERQEWLEAIRCFKAITVEDVTYRDATGQLEYARRQDELESLYSQGLSYAQKGDWQQAIARFEAVLKLDKNYKDTAARLKATRKRADSKPSPRQDSRAFDWRKIGRDKRLWIFVLLLLIAALATAILTLSQPAGPTLLANVTFTATRSQQPVAVGSTYTPTASPTPTPLASHTPAASREATATSSSAVAPTTTDTPSPTATASPTPASTATATPTSAPTLTAAATPMPSHTPTTTPTPAPTLMPAPVLLTPQDGAEYCAGNTFWLEWAWDARPFGPNEYYGVKVWKNDPEFTDWDRHWEEGCDKRLFEVELQPDERAGVPPKKKYFQGPGNYQWNVVVLFDTGQTNEDGSKIGREISEMSETRQFIVLSMDDARCTPP